MKIKNKQLNEINKTYKNLSNKELSNALIMLYNDFERVKVYLLELTNTLDEFDYVYKNLYDELQYRLKFKSKNINENN